jgi:4-diphosphocytidyl-2-C-methyl-D-erythritol kinase
MIVPHRCKTLAPAKLNLFLELNRKREDGYHDIDTVVVPINWFDQVEVTRTAASGVQLQVDWSPSRTILTRQLGVAAGTPDENVLLEIPTDSRNLVHRGLSRFAELFQISGGFTCTLVKQIPAGAGMGGASSDVAAALRCAARSYQISDHDERLHQLAAELGSDVPFFLGVGTERRREESITNTYDAHRGYRAARATGRGELIQPLEISRQLDVVVAFPGRMLSTPRVYQASAVSPDQCQSSAVIEYLTRGSHGTNPETIFNRLRFSAETLETRIVKTRQMMGQLGLIGCQMTGSGSACFGFAKSFRHARIIAAKLCSTLQPGTIVRVCRTIRVPLPVVGW